MQIALVDEPFAVRWRAVVHEAVRSQLLMSAKLDHALCRVLCLMVASVTHCEHQASAGWGLHHPSLCSLIAVEVWTASVGLAIRGFVLS